MSEYYTDKIPPVEELEESFKNIKYLYEKFVYEDCSATALVCHNLKNLLQVDVKKVEKKMQKIYDEH